jgi:hypothetical protein
VRQSAVRDHNQPAQQRQGGGRLQRRSVIAVAAFANLVPNPIFSCQASESSSKQGNLFRRQTIYGHFLKKNFLIFLFGGARTWISVKIILIAEISHAVVALRSRNYPCAGSESDLPFCGGSESSSKEGNLFRYFLQTCHIRQGK